MDFNRLRPGEQIAGISGLALILIMFIFSWFGVENVDEGANAWESFSVIDLILFLAAAVAIALAVATAAGEQVNLPVALSAIVAGLGILAVILVVFRIISPPDFDIAGFSIELPGGAVETPDVEIDTTRKIGVWLGLIASLGIAYGGWRSMQDEGTTFGAQADRLQDRVGGDEPPAPPPPPPPSSTPPSAP